MRWFVDGNNVMGSRPDGWWNDPAAAKARLTQEIAEWCRTHDDLVVVVFDRPISPAAEQLAGGNLGVEFAPRRGRDAADHHIVTLVEAALADRGAPRSDPGTTTAHDATPTDETPRPDQPRQPDQPRRPDQPHIADDSATGPIAIVVTADRGLIERLPPGVDTLGPGRFRERLVTRRRR